MSTKTFTIPAQRTAEPTSLTQVATSSRNSCPSCGSTRLTELSMTLTDGTPVSFTSCHACEHKSWAHGGDNLTIDTVLRRATKPKAS